MASAVERLAEALGGFGEDVLLLAEGEADLGAAGGGVVVEDGVGDGDDAARSGRVRQKVRTSTPGAGDVRGDEVRAGGR